MLVQRRRRWANIRPVLGCVLAGICQVACTSTHLMVYSLISNISSDFYMFTTWSLDLFIRVPSQLHEEHTVLQSFRRIELIIHIAFSVLPGTHFHLSQVKHLRFTCLAQGHNIETMSQYWEWRNMIFLWKSCTKRDSKPTAGSDIDKAPRSNYCAMSLSKRLKGSGATINPLSPHDALKHLVTSLKTDLVFLQLPSCMYIYASDALCRPVAEYYFSANSSNLYYNSSWRISSTFKSYELNCPVCILTSYVLHYKRQPVNHRSRLY